MTEDAVGQVQTDVREIRKDVKDLVRTTGEFNVATVKALARIEERVDSHGKVVKKISGAVALVVTSLAIALAKISGFITK